MKKRGKITPNGVVLKTHENATAVFLTEQGFDVDLIPASNIEGVHTPRHQDERAQMGDESPTGRG